MSDFLWNVICGWRISLRSRLRSLGACEGEVEFEGKLQDKLKSEYDERI